jgi:adenylate kinase
MGPPGSGKGTLSSSLMNKKDIYHLSTGDLFRVEISNKTDLGLKAVNLMNQGLYVTDDITNEMVKKKISSLDKSLKFVVFDGYPRTLDQAKYIEQIINIDYIVELKIKDDVIYERLTGRLICKNPTCKAVYHIKSKPPKENNICDLCKNPLFTRSDDKPELVITRLNEYKNLTEPIIKYFKEKTKYLEIQSEHTEHVETEFFEKVIGDNSG